MGFQVPGGGAAGGVVRGQFCFGAQGTLNAASSFLYPGPMSTVYSTTSLLVAGCHAIPVDGEIIYWTAVHGNPWGSSILVDYEVWVNGIATGATLVVNANSGLPVRYSLPIAVLAGDVVHLETGQTSGANISQRPLVNCWFVAT